MSTVVKRRRIPIADFPMFNSGDHPRIVLYYLEICEETGSPIDPAWLQGRNQAAPDVVLQESVKRKAVEGPSDTP